MRKLTRLAAAALLPLMLSGCLAFGSIQNRGASVDQSVGVFQNRATLMNVVRASRGEPLYFISLGSITASATADLKIAPPTIEEGPGFARTALNMYAFSNTANVLDNNTLTSFQANLLNTKDFYTGMMSPVQWNDVNLLIRQGFPREIIFYLVVDKAKFTPIVNNQPDDKNAFFIYNNPTDHQPIGPNKVDQFQAFQLAITRALMAGATTDIPAADHGGGGAKGDHGPAVADPNGGGGGGDTGGPQQVVAQQAAGAKTIDFVIKQQPETAPNARLCFERTEATADMQSNDFAKLEANKTPPIYCGSPKGSGSQVLLVDVGPPGHSFELPFRVDIYTRSVSGIFSYLGLMVRDPSLAPMMGTFTPPGQTPISGPLFSVRGGGFTDCFASVEYAHQIWCAAQDGPGAANTRVVFNILTDLVATKQSPGDIPASSTVLLTP
jgi:hypothetical protein